MSSDAPTGCWLVVEWQNGEQYRCWFERTADAERFGRGPYLTATGRLKSGLKRLALIPDPDLSRRA